MDERALITTTLIFSVSAKTLVPFFLRKERPENAFLTLIKKHCKIVQKNKLCHSKQQQIDYLMIYDVIYWFFDQKIGLFQQTVVRGLLYP